MGAEDRSFLVVCKKRTGVQDRYSTVDSSLEPDLFSQQTTSVWLCEFYLKVVWTFRFICKQWESLSWSW